MPAATQLTGDIRRPAQLLYFTTPSVTVDGRHLVAVRESADGNPNIISLNLKTVVERERSLNRYGTLKSYVYFRGNPLRGLGKASISLDAQRGIVYYLQGNDLCAVNFSRQRRVIAHIPDDQVTAFTHISADGK